MVVLFFDPPSYFEWGVTCFDIFNWNPSVIYMNEPSFKWFSNRVVGMFSSQVHLYYLCYHL